MSTAMAPQEGDGVALINGQEGWIVSVISRWTNPTCWDVRVLDTSYEAEIPLAGYDRHTRITQVRPKKNDPKQQWLELKL